MRAAPSRLRLPLATAVAVIAFVCLLSSSATARGSSGDNGYADTVLSDNPAAFWQLNDTSGQTAVDATGNGHNGSYIGSPSLASAETPMSSQAVTLSNAVRQAGQRVDVSYNADLNPSSYTLEAWVKLNQLPGNGDYGSSEWRSILCSRDHNGEQVGYQLYVGDDYNGAPRFAFLVGGPPPAPYAPNPVSYIVYDTQDAVTVGQWYHIVATMQNASGSSAPTLGLYVNGEDVASSAVQPNNTLPSNCGDPTRIGACQDSSGNPTSGFNGSLADVAIYSGVLSADRIQAHYEAATEPEPPVEPPTLTLEADGPTALYSGGETSFSVSVDNVDDATGAQLTARVTGANGRTIPLTVDGTTASFSYSGANVGTDRLEVSGQIDGQSVDSNSIDINWLTGSQSPENSLGAIGNGSGAGSYLNSAVASLLDPVNSSTGNFYDSATDVSVPGTGIPFSLARTYNSRDEGSGPLGRGWSANLFSSLAIDDAGNVTFKAGSGQQIGFALQSDGSYQGDSNVTATLAKSDSGYDLVQKDQDVQHFDLYGRLVSWLDPNGQGLHFSYDGGGLLKSVTDAAGREIDLSYNGGGLLTGVALPGGTTLSYGYDGDLLTSFTDQNGAETTYAYDAGGFLKSATDGSGKLLFENTYDDQGRVLTQKDAQGNEGTFDWSNGSVVATDAAQSEWKDTYNDSSQLSKRTDALGNDASYIYDDANNLLSTTDPLGNKTTMTYDERGNMLTRTDALGNTERWTYDQDNNVLSHTDQLGHVTSYSYDSNKNVLSETDPLGNKTSYSYDSSGHLIATTDPLGRTTKNVYDDQGNLIATISSSGAKTTYAYDSLGRRVSETDPLGHTTTSKYDADGRLIKTTNPLGRSTTSSYDDAGRLVAKTDANGNTTQHKYDSLGRQIEVINPDGSSTHSSYDAVDNLIASTDALGNVTRYVYDKDGRQIETISPAGARTETAYDANGNATSSTDALDNKASTKYDALGRKVETTDPLGRTTKTVYDAAGNTIKTIDPLGNETTSRYDADGRLVKTIDPLGNFTTSGYDAAGQLVAETDANGNTTRHAYDADGREISVTHSDGSVSSSSYDIAGNLVSSTDENGHTTTYAYDAAGNKVSETNPLGEKTTYAYDANGNQVSETDPLGHTSKTVYDSMNREISDIDPLGNSTKTAYDANGNVIAKTDPLGNKTISSYDADGNLVKSTDPLGHSTAYAYDAAGQQTSKTDANGHTTSYAYDAAGEKISVTAPGGAVTSYAYDGNGNVLKRTDANGHVTTYSNDAAGNKVSMTNPLGRSWSYSYDGNGNLTKTKTPSGGTITETYNPENRLLKTGYSDGTPSVSYTYDPAGNKLSMTDGTGTTRYAYDAADQRVGVSSARGSFIYLYDQGGNILSRTYPNGLRTSYSYNDAGEMVAAQVGKEITLYTYDADGNLASTLHPNGILDTRSYDAAGHVAEIKGTDAHGKPFYSRSYSYDPVGNPTSLEATTPRDHALGWWGNVWLDKGAQLTKWTETYTYDAQDRLTKACMNETCSRYLSYSYDPVGDRTQLQTRRGTISYSYDAADELLGTNRNHHDLTSYSYDPNGNETKQGSTSYSYNLANELTQVTNKGDKISYTYTGDGVMATRSTHSETTSYAWDTSFDLPEMATETDSTGLLVKQVITDTRSYTFGAEALGLVTKNGTFTFHADALGSVVELTDGRGKLVDSYRYTPFGGDYGSGTSDEDDAANPVRYTGQYLDSASGLYDMRAREYDSETGRLLETDPLEADTGEPTASVYVYVNDRPTVMTDPSGEKALMATVATASDVNHAPSINGLCAYYASSGDRAPETYTKGNGCGPNGFVNKLIPDSLPGLFNFKSACNNHDWCYGQVWGFTRAHCDSNFLNDMNSWCGSHFTISWLDKVDGNWIEIELRYSTCLGFAQLYYHAVRGWSETYSLPPFGPTYYIPANHKGRKAFTKNQLGACPYKKHGKTDVPRCMRNINARSQ